MTKAKVTEKFRSGASVPLRPVHTVTPSRNTPSSPHANSTGGLSSAREIAGRTGRQRESSNLLVCQATVRAKNETMRTSDAAQANSHSGIGRSCRPTSACPTTWNGASSIRSLSSG